uniref:Calcium channel, voltage-dependent, alpha 2/delta subunit 4a n=1 Tax=Hucho hucho TaxID=62062 RepID=A0A4W5KFU9_9TELE
MFVTQAVPDSNLLMLVVQADCDCSRQYPAITMEPKEVKYNASVKCDRMKSQKVRRRPESCHAYHPQVSTPYWSTASRCNDTSLQVDGLTSEGNMCCTLHEAPFISNKVFV